tara:strand:- start:842 stop:1333 length:492 start_codon:yes stop_codon:yes gene_type:complete
MRHRQLIFLFLISQIICGQSTIINSPFLISSAGENWIQENYNLCFSLGEIAIETYEQSDVILTQGFHQEDNYQITSIHESIYNWTINIYPNPTPDVLNIRYDDLPLEEIHIKDTKGSIINVFKKTFSDMRCEINLSHLSAGVYFLEALLSSGEKQVYQIQKFN